MKIANWSWLAVLAVTVAACTNKSKDEAPARTVFFDKSGMDTTVKPGDNFFLYANGKWIKDTKIPATETGWGLANILYKSGMDTVTIDKLGYEPVKPLLAKINAAKDYKDLVKLSADGFKTGDGFL